jgi:HEAT repeat protein
MTNFNFNPENFGLGLLAGWISAYGVYRARNILGAVRQTVSEQATSAQLSATRSADSRYINDMTFLCETSHLAGRFVHLSEIVIEPRFIPAPELVAAPEDDIRHDVFYVVPRFPDLPYLHAPYNLETLSIEDLGKGDRSIALLGLPGSGRTTALQTIALWGMGKVKFEYPKDTVQQMLDREEAQLSAEDRAKRIKERLIIEERARERLAEEMGEGFDHEAAEKAGLPLFQRLMPIYVHMANISLSSNEYGKSIDPAEPLVRALQFQTRRITSKTLPRNVYNRLNKGQALVMIDGYDDLPESERFLKLAWLEAFVEEYRRNFIIVTGPAQGYGKLASIGLTPVFIRPWSDLDSSRAAQNWAKAWPTISKRRRAAGHIDESLIWQARSDSRSLSPLEVTLKIWSTYSSGAETGYEEWLSGFIKRSMPKEQMMDEMLWHMASAAALQLDEGYVTPSRLEAVLSGQTLEAQVVDESQVAASESTEDMAASDEGDVFTLDASEDDENIDAFFETEAGSDEDDLDALLQQTEAKVTPKVSSPAADTTGKDIPTSKKDTARIGKDVAKLLSTLRQGGLLVAFRGGRFQFRHPGLAAYLAGLSLQRVTQTQLAEKAFKPEWSQAIGYAALLTPIDAAVKARMSAPADVLHNHLLEVARWLPYAGPQATWRAQVLRQLSNVLASPNQYTLVRERIAAALVGTRDRSLVKVFRTVLGNENPDLRRLACLGLGVLGEEDTVNDLAAMLGDPVNEVQIAAALGLGAIGSNEALEIMAEILTGGTEQLRQAASETFSAIPDEGYPVLYDAINHEEMMIRRAAVFGLRRVKTLWSVIAIYKAFLEDQQWYVRSAAQQVFEEMQYAETGGVRSYPPLEAVPWLRSWLNDLGEDAPKDQNPDDLLVTGLAEGEPLVRRLAAETLGQLGIASKVNALYAALYDQDEVVRDTAHRALGELQMRIGQPLPAPA